MVRLRKMFNIGINSLDNVTKKSLNKQFTSKRFDTKRNPSTDDISEAINNVINSPGESFSNWVSALYPVKYPDGHVVVSVREKGEKNTFHLYDYTYDKESGEATLSTNFTELEDGFKVKKFKRKENDEFNFSLEFDVLGSNSYLLPEAFQSGDVVIEKGKELRLVTGIVLEPETTDGQGDIYSAEEIRKSAHEFIANYSGQGNGLMHKSFGHEALRIVESYIAPVDFSIGGQTVRKGTWVMSSLILDDKLWGLIKKGKLTGYSIRGVSATREP